VQRRQAEKFADRDAEIAATRQQAYAEQVAPEPAASADDDRLDQLERLADLRSKNVLTEEEFAAEKARVLRG
jgi:hypothetical protein